ncbi:hypothetical protein D3C76_1199890 [compost metagenome]
MVRATMEESARLAMRMVRSKPPRTGSTCWSLSTSCSSICGCRSWNSGISGPSLRRPKDMGAFTRSTPRSSPTPSRARCSASSRAASRSPAYSKYSAPASVRCRLRVVRTSSCTPMTSSSACICLLRVERGKCPNRCGEAVAAHAQSHERARQSNVPVSDFQGFWGAFGCSCFAF